MLLEAADANLHRDPATARDQLSLARTAARENLAESRSLVAPLSPPTLSAQGLVGALTRLTERLDAEMTGVATRLTVHGVERRLSPAAEVVLLRAAQEALTNVRKHSAAITVAVTLDFDTQKTTLTICDDGRGFALDTTDGGFGLHGMRSRVTDIDGSLSVRSAPGAGTTRLRLGPVTSADPDTGQGVKIRVVLVDDHPVVRAGIIGMLAAESDIEVVGEAGTGRAALRVVAAVRPDVVLMDLRMPDLDGVDATRALRARENPPRVVILTTYETDADILRAVEAGATGYLLKDAPRQDLAEAVLPRRAARLCSRRRSRRSWSHGCVEPMPAH